MCLEFSASCQPPTLQPLPLSLLTIFLSRPPATPDTPSPSPSPKRQRPKKRRAPPPLNQKANWDDWDGDADCRLVDLKTDPHLRHVARRVGFSVEHAKLVTLPPPRGTGSKGPLSCDETARLPDAFVVGLVCPLWVGTPLFL